uniref:Helicase C-terminal domain-containing protein n=1 Tax=Panagrolaimus sp. PS1159 TaxID=55785 RepID=A0AC35GRS8_9BILA
VMLKTEQFDDEAACENALQNCDLVFLTADGFNKFVKDELVLFENLKVLIVHGLDWEADKKRIVQYKDMFEYHDFPKVDERILVFFDDNYSTIAEDVLAEDNKAFIVYGAGDGSKNLRVITDQDINTELEEIFEIHATEDEKDAALVEFLKPLIEPFKIDPYTCPRTVIYVNSPKTGARIETLVRRSNLECTFVDGQRKRKDCQFMLDRFMHDRYPPILIACNLSRVLNIPQFVDVTNIIHFEVPEFCATYQMNSQLCIKGFEPKKIISYLGAADYPAYEELLAVISYLGAADYPAYEKLLAVYVRDGKNVEKLQQVLTALKPLFEQIPVEYDPYEEEEWSFNDY